MKRSFACCVCAAFLFSAGLPAHADTFETRRCINMGNALDAPNEGEWGHRIDARSFKAIAAAGFDTVRIPVRWSAHAGGAPDFKIDDVFFSRVTQVLDQALANDLQVILNIHHFEELNDAPEENTEEFIALWDQIASRYQSLPSSVYFEVINEPNTNFKGDVMRRIVSRGFEKIRETNPTRIVIVGGDEWSGIRSLPSIPSIKDPNQVYTFHFYDPFTFTHQKAGWTRLKNSDTKRWGSPADRAELKAAAEYAAKFKQESGVPLFLGEFGAYEKAPYDDVVEYIRETRAAFENVGVSWCAWNFTATFAFYDSGEKKWDQNKLAALGFASGPARPTSTDVAANAASYEGQSLEDAFNALRRKIGRDGDLLMLPFAHQLAEYGAVRARKVKDKGVPDGKALEVRTRASENPWDGGISGPLAGRIERGDTVVMAYWARVVKGEGVIANAGLQLSDAPYSPMALEPARLDAEWKRFLVSATADRDYGPDEAGYTLQVAGAKQTLRIGPVMVLNLGQGVDITQLPRE